METVLLTGNSGSIQIVLEDYQTAKCAMISDKYGDDAAK